MIYRSDARRGDHNEGGFLYGLSNRKHLSLGRTAHRESKREKGLFDIGVKMIAAGSGMGIVVDRHPQGVRCVGMDLNPNHI